MKTDFIDESCKKAHRANCRVMSMKEKRYCPYVDM